MLYSKHPCLQAKAASFGCWAAQLAQSTQPLLCFSPLFNQAYFYHAGWSNPRLGTLQRVWQRSLYFIWKVFSAARDCLLTPASSLQKDQVDTKTLKFLQRHSQPKKKACKAHKNKFVATGGDSVLEGLTSNLKHTARYVVANSNQKSVTAQRLRRACMYSVLDSSKLLREACSDSTLTLSPRDAFDYWRCPRSLEPAEVEDWAATFEPCHEKGAQVWHEQR